jgi:hypothetical protein
VRLNTISVLVFITLFSVGCTSEVQPTLAITPSATATLLPTKTTTPSPTPPTEIVIQDINLLAGDDPGEYYVIGILENQSGEQIESISIRVSILDKDENLLSEQVVPPFLNRLSPKAESPFKAYFTNVGEAASVTAHIDAFQSTEYPEAMLEISDLTTVPTIDGGIAILGLVENPNATSMVIDALGLLMVDPQGDPIDLLPYTAGLSMLDPGDRVPFLVLLPEDPGEVEFLPYYCVDPTRGELAASLSVSTPPKVLFTEQGNPLIIGTITNEDERPFMMEFLIVVRIEDEILTIASIRPSLPLRPGETRPYAFTDFPGLAAQLARYEAQVGELTAEILVDRRASRPSDRTLVQLDVQITQFEPIGSSLFIKGVIYNPNEKGVESATVLAAVYSTAGELLTAGWTDLREILPANESHEFILHLSLPQGADPAMNEYDLQALGLLP